jgi:hypothetical protein
MAEEMKNCEPSIPVGILSADDQCRFGFHNLRHSLASFLVSVGTNPRGQLLPFMVD